MTNLLEQAVAEAAKLSPAEQDTLAAVLLAEITTESRWSETLADSQPALNRFAAEAVAEHHAGRTEPL
jgi:hypothetical protein